MDKSTSQPATGAVQNMPALPAKVESTIAKLPPKARGVVEAAFKRENRKAAVAAAHAAKAPGLALLGGGAMGALDAAAENMGIDFSLEIGPVTLTPGLTLGLGAMAIGVVEGDPTLAAIGSGAGSIITYNLGKSVVADLLA